MNITARMILRCWEQEEIPKKKRKCFHSAEDEEAIGNSWGGPCFGGYPRLGICQSSEFSI